MNGRNGAELVEHRWSLSSLKSELVRSSSTVVHIFPRRALPSLSPYNLPTPAPPLPRAWNRGDDGSFRSAIALRLKATRRVVLLQRDNGGGQLLRARQRDRRKHFSSGACDNAGPLSQQGRFQPERLFRERERRARGAGEFYIGSKLNGPLIAPIYPISRRRAPINIWPVLTAG